MAMYGQFIALMN